jgi:hypothetical protein
MLDGTVTGICAGYRGVDPDIFAVLVFDGGVGGVAVVPATSVTITRSSPASLLISELLPALGLPMTATLIYSSSSGPHP